MHSENQISFVKLGICLILSAILHLPLLRSEYRLPRSSPAQMEVRRGLSAVELTLLPSVANNAPEPEAPPPPRPVAEELPVKTPEKPAEFNLPEPKPEESVPEPPQEQKTPAAENQEAKPQSPPPSKDLNADPRIQGVDSYAAPGITCNPVYPRLSRRRGEEGTVVITLTVLQNGRIKDEQIKQSSGYPLLDEAALTAIRTSRFKPAIRNGKPLTSSIEQTFVFKLEGR